jgi:predicted permease
MFLESFRITGLAVVQIFILGAIGFFLVKRGILGDGGLDALSRLAIDVTLPILIFCQLIKDFSFALYPNWWIFPLISIAITVLGFIAGSCFKVFVKGQEEKKQFRGLVTFQNSGYLPLPLFAALLPPDKSSVILIYLFLFLLGFNLVMFSIGVYILAFAGTRKFEWQRLFSPPVVATIVSLILVFFGINKYVPDFVIKPLRQIGDSTLPLAMLVVGGSLAQIKLGSIDKKAMALLVLAKLVVLPLVGLLLLIKLKLPELIGLLILIELAVPSANSLTAIVRAYKRDDILISQGIFISHILSIITLPVFLSLYFALVVIQ